MAKVDRKLITQRGLARLPRPSICRKGENIIRKMVFGYRVRLVLRPKFWHTRRVSRCAKQPSTEAMEELRRENARLRQELEQSERDPPRI